MNTTDKPLVNKVAKSGLITIDLESFFPKEALCVFDIKDYLFMELILKEKDFRAALQNHDWSQYEGKNLTVYCSSDAIVPLWAYMLVTVYAAPFAKTVVHGSPEEFYKQAFQNTLSKLDYTQYEGKKIVIKGCSKKPVPPSAYVELTRNLLPFAKSIMYGEPCSTVPVFKQKPQK